ncbi:MAG TPA: hypothetical protein VLC08_15825 [Chitinolyticbacter sp.]|nr:hypothetical protein [Chitinolyticbacter sp.]
MLTALDSRHELELNSLKYDGRHLIAEVGELIIGYGGRMSAGTTSYVINFPNPVAHPLTEEFPAVY